MSGLIILPIFIFYVVVAFFVFKLLLSMFRKKFSNILLLILVILLPFWDLLFQFGIRSFYQVFLLNPIVYEMPQKDKDGKIESIGDSLTFYLSMKNIIDKEKLVYRLNRIYPNLKEKVSDYIELNSMTGSYENKTNKDVIVKIFMLNNSYEIIDKTEARYIKKSVDNPSSSLLGFKIRKDEYQIYDTKLNKVIGSAPLFVIGTVPFMEYIRREYFLMYVGPNQNELFNVGGAGYASYDELVKILFDIEGL
ncbi:MAG: hypothetical protein HRT40_09345 [Campylobacteraceae bacterium]|nr:hypothetical protein [Campylobacteraceae bacterium]